MNIKKIALGLLLEATPAYATQQKDVSKLLDAMKADKKTIERQSIEQRYLSRNINDKEYRINFSYQKGKKSELQIGIFKDGMLVETFTDKGLDGIVEDHMLNKEWQVMESNDGEEPYLMTFGNDRTKSNERFLATVQDILNTYKK